MLSSQSPSHRVAEPAAFASAVPAGGAAGFATFLPSSRSAQFGIKVDRLTNALEIICLDNLVVVEQVLHDEKIHILLRPTFSIMRHY